ncbi:MAG: YdeI/OmpD-associated family protein [Dehalococcoidia bacterium]|jgi:hypothetical protein|nr:YdeI/OmpD-associated family protein [Dehalococcoidia bacterium]|tara:strand:+ start:81 stop:572 length:492 start_codon:yes stop_codon:yes gene_type:complete
MTAAPQPAPENRFTAHIYKLAMNYCVDVPAEVSRVLSPDGRPTHYVPVTATVTGQTARTRLVPRGGGRHRLFLGAPLREAAGAGEGDEVAVTLSIDTNRSEPPLPDDLRAALEDVEGAAGAFAALTPAQHGGMRRFLAEARRPQTRARRIERIVTEMHDRTWS